ncbi:MAG: sulfotransferase [Candidatus Hydrogenedentes bacterium]|nr:sulfotransferase [Candidatus Hydrogenedentota bacterium]
MNNIFLGNDLIIVTGLPRSGTSLIMQILKRIGVPILYENSKVPDEHNPHGYYEYERVKEIPVSNNWEWLKDYRGYAVKIISPILISIPIDFPCRIIVTSRAIEEVIISQEKMIGTPKLSSEKEYLKSIYKKHMTILRKKIEKNPWVKTIEVNYNELIFYPYQNLEKLSSFLKIKINIEEVSKIIDPTLYRVRF